MRKTGKHSVRMMTLMMAMLLAVLVLGAGAVYAGEGDRSPAGATAISAGGTVSVPEGTWTKLSFGKTYDYQSYFYFKITPSKTGTIKFMDDFTNSYSVVLCNENKKVISVGQKGSDDFFSWNSPYPWQRTVCYGVKKGKTYLIRVKGASRETRPSTNDPYVGNVMWTNSKVKASKYGKSKKKAVKMKRKKKVKGLFVAGNKKAQWFKIKTRSKKTYISIEAKNCNGTIRAQVKYKSWGRWWTDSLNTYRGSSSYQKAGRLTSNKKRQVVYVKVVPDGKSSGAYTLKWK